MPLTITLTREELFNLVWSKPLRDVAKDLGLSDVGLAKQCRKSGIPLPQQGYWMITVPEDTEVRVHDPSCAPPPMRTLGTPEHLTGTLPAPRL